MRAAGPTTGAGRLLRGGATGAATGVLAVLAHVSAGGALPDLSTVAGPVLAISTVATGAARVRLGPAALLALLGLGQLAVHVLLILAAGHGHTSDTAAMTAAHLTATAVVLVCLTGTEHTLFALFDALAARLPSGRPPLAVLGPRRTPCPPQPQRRTFLHVLYRRIRGRRGPPGSTLRPSALTV